MVSFCRTPEGKSVPVVGDRECRHGQRTIGLLNLRFPVGHVAGRQLQYVFLNSVLHPLHLAILFSLKPLFFHLVVRTDPSEGARNLLGGNVLQLQPFPMPNYTRGGPSTSPCSAPRSSGIRESPSLLNEEEVWCCQPATAASLERRELAALRTAPHSLDKLLETGIARFMTTTTSALCWSMPLPRRHFFTSRDFWDFRITVGARMITKIILENNLICNLTNKKNSRKKNRAGG